MLWWPRQRCGSPAACAWRQSPVVSAWFHACTECNSPLSPICRHIDTRRSPGVCPPWPTYHCQWVASELILRRPLSRRHWVPREVPNGPPSCSLSRRAFYFYVCPTVPDSQRGACQVDLFAPRFSQPISCPLSITRPMTTFFQYALPLPKWPRRLEAALPGQMSAGWTAAARARRWPTCSSTWVTRRAFSGRPSSSLCDRRT